MDVITAYRGSGKTRQLIKRAAKTKSTIVCAHFANKSHIEMEAKEMGLSIPVPILFSEFIAGGGTRKNARSYMIDDLEDCLKQLSKGLAIEAIVISIEKL